MHRHGRSVIIAGFSSGTQVVYKPRSLDVDCHFNELIAWINARGHTPPLRAVRALSMDDHGWAEFAPNAPCVARDEVGRFYDRFGAYLAILHALKPLTFTTRTSSRRESIRCSIDLEALFHPLPEPAASIDEPEWLGWDTLQHSVLRAGILPFRAYDSDKSSGLDMSAMGGAGGQQTPNRLPVLVAAGTDEMRLERDFVRLPESQNRPALGGKLADPIAVRGSHPGGLYIHVPAAAVASRRASCARWSDSPVCGRCHPRRPAPDAPVRAHPVRKQSPGRAARCARPRPPDRSAVGCRSWSAGARAGHQAGSTPTWSTATFHCSRAARPAAICSRHTATSSRTSFVARGSIPPSNVSSR